MSGPWFEVEGEIERFAREAGIPVEVYLEIAELDSYYEAAFSSFEVDEEG